MISSKATGKISKIIDSLFATMASDFLGFNPDSERISKHHNNLISIFIKGLGENPTAEERDILKTSLQITYSYIDGLKSRTKARILDKVIGLSKELSDKDLPMDSNKLREIVGKELSVAGSNFKMAINSEANKIRNLSTAMKIEKISASKGVEDPYVFWIVTLDDKTAKEPEKTLHLIPGTTIPRVWKLSEIKHEFWKKGMKQTSIYGGHPNCFLGWQNINIFTENDGYKNIKDVKIGERVLTHTGKFKTVLGNLETYDKKYYGKYYTIKYTTVGRDGKRQHTTRVTPDHEFMTQRGWVKAEELKTTDKFTEMLIKCGSCDNLVQPKPKRMYRKSAKNLDSYFCSNQCSSLYQWKCDNHKENISKKSSKQMKKAWENPTEEMLNITKKMQNAFIDLIKEGKAWFQLPENYEKLQKNAAIINSRFGKNNPSKEETQVFELVKSIYPEALSNEVVKKFCVDILLEHKKTIIEYDGGGHYLPVYCKNITMENFMAKQKGRDKYLNKCGYHVIRYSEIPTKEQIIEDIQRVSSNNNADYSFRNISIDSIEYKKSGSFKLYDLKIEDDESFIVNGIVSHNCRCVLTYLASGYGFDEKGRVTYIGRNHDEYLAQKKKYKI